MQHRFVTIPASGRQNGESREIRTPNLLIWSQTRYCCAIPPLELHFSHSSNRKISTCCGTHFTPSTHRALQITNYGFMFLPPTYDTENIVLLTFGRNSAWSSPQDLFHINVFHTFFLTCAFHTQTAILYTDSLQNMIVASSQLLNVHTKITLRIFVAVRPIFW